MEDVFSVATTQYQPLSEATLPAYLAAIPAAAARLGSSPVDWTVREVGDGNLNLVFIVDGPAGSVVVKQALPYLRLVGDSWPLPLERSYFESLALAEQQAVAPGMTPRLYAVDKVGAAITMEYLTPHVILRKALIRGRYLPRFAADMAQFMARSLFGTSDLCLPAARKKALMREFCGNTELCKITEDLVFTDPYRISPGNRWTSPELDADAARIRADAPLKAEVQTLKLKFLTSAEALIHGDLHTGSIMVTETDTLGFAGCKMIRRVLGLAHVEDLESIADPVLRATAERQVLALARMLILDRGGFAGMADVHGAFARIAGTAA